LTRRIFWSSVEYKTESKNRKLTIGRSGGGVGGARGYVKASVMVGRNLMGLPVQGLGMILKGYGLEL
jgi:hypothetical protein